MRAVGRVQPGRELEPVEDRHGLVRREVEAEPGDPVVVLREVLDLPHVPVGQLPLRHDLEHVPDGQGGDDAVGLDHLGLVVVREDPRLARHRHALHLVVLDHDLVDALAEPDLAAVLGHRVGEVLEEAVPALLGPERVGGAALLFVVHLADEEVVARRVIPPVLGHALEHRDELEQVDDALVVRVLVDPLAQGAVVPLLELLVGRVEQGLDHLLELVLVARVAVADRAPRVGGVIPDVHVGVRRPVAEMLAEVLEDLGDPRARVLEQVAAEVELEALVRHRHPAAAEVGRLVEDEHLLAVLREQRAGCQPGGSRSDHDDVKFAHGLAFLFTGISSARSLRSRAASCRGCPRRR